MCTVGTLKGTYHNIKDGTNGAGVMAIACGKWKYEECRDKKAREVKARSLKGMIADDARKAGFREQYNFKTLTLTYPGVEYRGGYDKQGRLWPKRYGTQPGGLLFSQPAHDLKSGGKISAS